MTRASIELVRAEQWRRWTRSEKERLVAASFEPGVSAFEIAREAGVHVSQLFRWRKLLCKRVVSPAPVPALVPVAVVPPPLPMSVEAEPKPTRPRCSGGHIEISLGGGRLVRVGSDVDGSGAASGARYPGGPMIPLPANVRVWLATGHPDMRKGFSSLGLIVQET